MRQSKDDNDHSLNEKLTCESKNLLFLEPCPLQKKWIKKKINYEISKNSIASITYIF